jgi:hypothetical protein
MRRGFVLLVLFAFYAAHSLRGEGMTDDLKQSDNPGDTRIHIEWNHEVSYWSKKFNVSPEELRKAVESVGPLVKDVERQLGR